MRTLKLTLAVAAGALMLTSCNDEQKQMAKNKVDNYSNYIDSVSNVAADKASANWEAIERNYETRKAEANSAIISVEDNADLQESIDKSTSKYEEFKAEVMAENQRMEGERITMMRQSLLGKDYVDDQMAFGWINKDNILSVYQNFVDTVEKNKDSYTREQWDEIKLLYEAIDTRKNTVENEGLSSADNRKIATLKLKFAPMYTVNRMGAKSEENAEAKQ